MLQPLLNLVLTALTMLQILLHVVLTALAVLAGHGIFVLQSRSEVASEAENVLSELSHHLTHVVREPLEDSHQLQSQASKLHNFSQQMLARLTRLVTDAVLLELPFSMILTHTNSVNSKHLLSSATPQLVLLFCSA